MFNISQRARMKLLWWIVVSVIIRSQVDCARILVMAPICFRSHKQFFTPIIEALGAQGHQLTVVSPFPSKTKMENIRDIVIEDFIGGSQMGVDWFSMGKGNAISSSIDTLRTFRMTQKAAYESLMAKPEFQHIVKTRDVDLAIVLAVLNDFTLPIIDHLSVPFIYCSATITVPWLMSSMSTSQEYAYMPAFGTDFTDRMSFAERLTNVLRNEIGLLIRPVALLWMLDEMVKKDLPDVRPITEIERDAQLLLVNYHPTIAWPRPLPPTIIPIVAMHLRPVQPLPKDFEDFANDAKEGFIVFSLGSVIPVSSMPTQTFQMFVNVFARLSQRVFWKWEKDGLLENYKISNNVMMANWLPQQDLLGHRNVKLFISHGGLLGIQEALYHGVPVLGFPFGNDQRSNMAKASAEGYAVKLDWMNLTESHLYDSIQTLITEESYRRNASRLSALMKDELIPAKKTAVYWIEYVLRHGGTRHLQASSKEMPFYQLYLLDIWLFLLSMAIVSLYVICKTFFLLLRILFGYKKVKVQ